MFSPLLYDHKFDIDDLIAALLGGESLFLETRTGKLSTARPDMDDAHCFKLMPLRPEWLGTLTDHDELNKLEEADVQELQSLAARAPMLAEILPTVQGGTLLGGWLRERVKDEAMQWLADNDLIPPSMRHINGVPKAKPTGAPKGVKKVSILPE